MTGGSRPLRIRPQAASEVNAAFVHYEGQRTGLGHEFLRAVDAAVAALGRDPGMHPEVRPGVRRALLRRFPYGVFFAAGDAAITVLAVLHHRRSPRRWPRPG